jgi:hypothetical protein
MSTLNRNKANDIYKIKPTIIRDLTPIIGQIITPIFNEAIDKNEYPDSLKLTKLIDLYKSKNKKFPANYRPISLLPILQKSSTT